MDAVSVGRLDNAVSQGSQWTFFAEAVGSTRVEGETARDKSRGDGESRGGDGGVFEVFHGGETDYSRGARSASNY